MNANQQYEPKFFDLNGQTAIVTGGAGILGTALCQGLLAHGANVVVADIDGQRATEVAASLQKTYGDRALPVACDVSNKASVEAMVNSSLKAFDGVDILLNNAAVFADDPKDYYAPFEEYSLEEWRRISAVNIDGVFLVAQAVGRQMVRQGRGGSIIQTASIYGMMASDNRIYEGSLFKGYPINNPAVYAASKAGVVGLTRWLATYWAEKNIRVNAIAPGGIFSFENEVFTKKYSARVPMGRMAFAHELVGAAVYLASAASSYTTGQCLLVDGGLSAW